MKLREITLSDKDNVLEFDSDPDVMQYLTGGKPSTPNEVQSVLEKTELLLKKHKGRFGFWAAIEKDSMEFMGWFHFRPSKQDSENLKRIELGYRLKKKFWGRGYATEGSLSLIAKGFEELGVKEVFAITAKENMASRKVMEKAGLSLLREFQSRDFPDSSEFDVEYVLHKNQWKKP